MRSSRSDTCAMLVDRAVADDGAVTVLTALLLASALLFFGAIVVDAGYLFDARAQLQAAADAGALAGCRELIATGDAGAAQAVARAAAIENAQGPGRGLTVTDVSVDMSDWSVQVVVGNDARTFFSRRLAGGGAGALTRRVVAAARARREALTGGRYLVPWAIPVLRNVDRVEVGVGGVRYALGGGAGVWSGTVPIPAPGADLEVHVINAHGIDEVLTAPAPAARVSVAVTGYPFSGIWLSGDYFPTDAPSAPVITARTAEPQTRVRAWVDGKTYEMAGSGGGTVWTVQVPLSGLDFADDLLTVFPVDLWVGNGGRDRTVDAYLHARRSTHPVANVSASPLVTAPGGSASVQVDLAGFDPVTTVPGQLYTLRVGSPSGMVGNYGELNFNKIVHNPGDPPDPPGVVPSGNRYYEWTAYGYPGGIHVGDVIEMSPGTSGANTRKALDQRAALADPAEGLVVAVPIVEKLEDKGGGAYDVVVVGFAAFRITSYDGKGDVSGEFIEYVANPSTFGGAGGGATGIYAPRLVNPR